MKFNTYITTVPMACGLGGAEPLTAKDSCICMGGGPSVGHGAQKVFNKFNENMRVLSVIEDSTFFHTGIASIMTAVYNRSNAIHCILDNRTTGKALDWAMALDEPSVIITRWPCVLKRHTEKDKDEFGIYKGTCKVDQEKCTGCKMCLKTGCPALCFTKETVSIDATQCAGCEVCAQVCPVKAIARVEA